MFSSINFKNRCISSVIWSNKFSKCSVIHILKSCNFQYKFSKRALMFSLNVVNRRVTERLLNFWGGVTERLLNSFTPVKRGFTERCFTKTFGFIQKNRGFLND